MNHTYAVDFFALGVIAYEFMIGKVIFFINLETLYWIEQEVNKIENFVKTSANRLDSSIWLVKIKC